MKHFFFNKNSYTSKDTNQSNPNEFHSKIQENLHIFVGQINVLFEF